MPMETIEGVFFVFGGVLTVAVGIFIFTRLRKALNETEGSLPPEYRQSSDSLAEHSK